MKILKLVLPLFLIFLLTSCGQNTGEDKGLKTNTESESVIRVLVPGNERTKGFMASGFRGFSRIKSEIDNVDIGYLSDIEETSDEILVDSLRTLAEDKPDLIIAVGGQNDKAAETVSKEFPEIQFVVIQGSVRGKNLSSYTVKQEQSSYLAGALAGLLTESNIVGHISGTTQQSGLDARGAFYHGLMSTNPEAKFLTTFTGDMDDPQINKETAKAQIDAGADYIFTMLNDGRSGTEEAIEESDHTVHAIGNAIDWTQENKIYTASAIADPSIAVFTAAKDYIDGNFESNIIKNFDLKDETVVNLTIRDTVPEETRNKIENIKNQISEEKLKIDTEYTGEDFK
ncbi:MAG: BMP family protein [Gallicola sp.]|nr:BMP family protein [Gallicola sp.]